MTITTLPTDIQTFLDDVGKKYGKNIQVLPKNSSKLMQAIGWLFRVTKISPDFMEEYITTIGETIYVPDAILANPDVESLLRVIVHEVVHVADSNRLSSPLFKFLYLFPQSLAPLALISLLGFWKTGFLWCLFFLLALAPLPAPFRYWFELRAYRTQLLFVIKEDNAGLTELADTYTWITEQMTTSLYYFTWPFPKAVHKDLENTSWMGTGIYKDIYSWMMVRRLAKKVEAFKTTQQKISE